MAYAHTLPNEPPDKWEPLERHLEEVARLAGDHASAFDAQLWGSSLGRWHDLGKYSKAFQDYLRRETDPDAGEKDQVSRHIDHSTFGAQYAAKLVGRHTGRILAFCIAGHHAGLPDGTSDDETTRRSTLEARLKLRPPRIPPVELPRPDTAPPALKLPFTAAPEDIGFQVAFFTRMLFSCLVDADRTATEAFCNPERSAARQRQRPTVEELIPAFDAFLQGKQATSERTPVNDARARVLADCLAAAPHEPGVFSLNVPTGGGKTYSSLAFALHHARAHGLRRVIVAIPFTSIIEQTADAFRTALGSLADRGLVEHHSNIDPKKNTLENALATENWDAPLVVTTNVQLYESLFSAATTPCRKLHRLARSVIVLDEAQTIPVEFLRPTLAALRELVTRYGCTVVLCTATQPALERRDRFPIGLEGVRPIVGDAAALFSTLKRVEVRQLGLVADDELADRLAAERAVLCVVNSRPHAARLYDALVERQGEGGCYHLSTFMCAQHRREMLLEIRRRLKAGNPCRVVSTQLIEAGVDVDFPVVYRAPAGFDSIAQAAGRCNREGRLACGMVYIFDTESPPPPGVLRHAAQAARELMDVYPDPLAPDAIEAYFRHYYWSQEHRWDKCEVMEALRDDLRSTELLLKFRTAARRYRIIQDEQTQILVPYDRDARKIRDRLLGGAILDFALRREVQRYLVGVRAQLLEALFDQGVLVAHDSGLFLLANDRAYSRTKGLSPDAVGLSAELLIE